MNEGEKKMNIAQTTSVSLVSGFVKIIFALSLSLAIGVAMSMMSGHPLIFISYIVAVIALSKMDWFNELMSGVFYNAPVGYVVTIFCQFLGFMISIFF